jgi:hypothetical protein
MTTGSTTKQSRPFWVDSLNCVASLAMTEPRSSAYAGILAARFTPEFCQNLPSSERRAQGRPGVSPHPWPACRKKAGGSHHRYEPKQPAFPARWFERLIRALPGDRLSCPRRRCDASTPHSTWHQHRDARTTRFRRTRGVVRLRENHAATSTRPPHPAPNVRDDREAPLLIEPRTPAVDVKFWKNEREIFLRESLDRGDRAESLRKNIFFAQANAAVEPGRGPLHGWHIEHVRLSADLPVGAEA